MAITRKMNEAAPSYTNERAYRASKLVEKWSQMPQIGKGISKMSESKARNLAILLENQSKYMSRMTEGVFADAFNGTTPENLLKLIRITYPNSVRGDLFTEFAMETANDSIKYIEPVYASATDLKNRTPIYEQVADETLNAVMVTSATHPAGDFIGYKDGAIVAVKVSDIYVVGASSTTIDSYVLKGADVKAGLTSGEIDETTMGEVELKVRSYAFQPKAYTLGVSWSQLAELILDSSFGVSAEEMLMDSAAQEIKKALDYQAIALAAKGAEDNSITFNAMNATDGTATWTNPNGENYFQRAQVVMQAVAKAKNAIYNTLQRGGVSAIVADPDVIEYFKLHKGFTNKGEQQACGAYKAGEVDGIELYVAPKTIVGTNTAITTWKNEAAGTDVSIAIGTLMALYSTGALARKGIYKEAGLANFSDTVLLNNHYLQKIAFAGLI